MQIRLPQVDKILRHDDLGEALCEFRREIVVRVVRQILDELRAGSCCPEGGEIVRMVKARLSEISSPSLKKVINGTGVVLNTNLGRAPISAAHLEALKTVAGGYCNLEINLETGKRGKRSAKLERLLKILCSAESSLAVNNNAAAIVLAVNCLALGKEVVVSRGELIEIGGSFRLPDVITAAGGRLREVGTTNKTRLSDFEQAIGPETGLVLRCHRSNFEVRGFTEEANLAELARLCTSRQIPLVEDLGSGAMLNLAELGFAGEPTVEEQILCGCDLVTFSGDKLLGGPQAGIIAGKKELVEKLARHPLYRALRLDKLVLSLLEQTFSAYLFNNPQTVLPTLSLIAAQAGGLSERIEKFRERAAKELKVIELKTISTSSAIGGGSLPGREQSSAGIVLQTPWKPTAVAQTLRKCEPPVVTITRDDDNIIDFRTVPAEEEDFLLKALAQLEDKLTI